MIDKIRFALQIRHVHAQMRKHQKGYEKELGTAMADNATREEFEKLNAAREKKLRMDDDEIQVLLASFVRQKAQRYFIYVPEFNETSPNWIKSDLTYNWRLSPRAITALQGQIREVERDRQSSLAAITGVIGTLIGLVALLLKFKT